MTLNPSEQPQNEDEIEKKKVTDGDEMTESRRDPNGNELSSKDREELYKLSAAARGKSC